MGGFSNYPPCCPGPEGSHQVLGHLLEVILSIQLSELCLLMDIPFSSAMPKLYAATHRVALKQGSVTKACCVFFNRFTLLQTRHMADQA